MDRTKAVILAGGEGSRLGILTFKRTKPAVPFAGKYRIIDFTLSNCVNSGIFDVMILAQYRPHSLIEHIGAGGPWDLNRDFTGGVRIYTPYKGRGASDWYIGTADAVQQNFSFIKQGESDLVLILSGDHIYKMNYVNLINFHRQNHADVTIATIRVPIKDATRFGIISVNHENQVLSFVEKPDYPQSNLVNMGVYLFNLKTLDKALWVDHQRGELSSHDFGKDILPQLVEDGKRVFSYPFEDYWVDVGTLISYWQANLDLLSEQPSINLNDRRWIIHTRTEERPPVKFSQEATIINSMISDGCIISSGAIIERSILGPGVRVGKGARIFESIILTDAVIGEESLIEHAIIEKRVHVGAGSQVGSKTDRNNPKLTTIGKNSILAPNMIIEPGAIISTDVLPGDFSDFRVQGDEYIEANRKPFEF